MPNGFSVESMRCLDSFERMKKIGKSDALFNVSSQYREVASKLIHDEQA
jgi:hypothetical protein